MISDGLNIRERELYVKPKRQNKTLRHGYVVHALRGKSKNAKFSGIEKRPYCKDLYRLGPEDLKEKQEVETNHPKGDRPGNDIEERSIRVAHHQLFIID